MSINTPEFLVVIPARLGSTRLPRKPLADIGGKPMVIHVAERAQQSNAQNKLSAHSRSKTQTLGVSWHKKAQKWQAHICVYKERKYLGLFDTIEKASEAYLNERKKVIYVCA